MRKSIPLIAGLIMALGLSFAVCAFLVHLKQTKDQEAERHASELRATNQAVRERLAEVNDHVADQAAEWKWGNDWLAMGIQETTWEQAGAKVTASLIRQKIGAEKIAVDYAKSLKNLTNREILQILKKGRANYEKLPFGAKYGFDETDQK